MNPESLVLERAAGELLMAVARILYEEAGDNCHPEYVRALVDLVTSAIEGSTDASRGFYERKVKLAS